MALTVTTLPEAPRLTRCFFCNGFLPSEETGSGEVVRMEREKRHPLEEKRIEYAHPECWREHLARSENR